MHNANDIIDLWPIQFSDYAADMRKSHMHNGLCQSSILATGCGAVRARRSLGNSAWQNNLAAGLPTHRIARTPSLAGILAVVSRPLPTVEQRLRGMKDLFSAFYAEKELVRAEIICEYIRRICGE
jgi:hypothetical protein